MGDAAIRPRIADDGACVQVSAAVGLGGRMLAPTLRRVILACRFSLGAGVGVAGVGRVHPPRRERRRPGS